MAACVAPPRGRARAHTGGEVPMPALISLTLTGFVSCSSAANAIETRADFAMPALAANPLIMAVMSARHPKPKFASPCAVPPSNTVKTKFYVFFFRVLSM